MKMLEKETFGCSCLTTSDKPYLEVEITHRMTENLCLCSCIDPFFVVIALFSLWYVIAANSAL